MDCSPNLRAMVKPFSDLLQRWQITSVAGDSANLEASKFDIPAPLHPIPRDPAGGRKMTQREFERVFRIPGNGAGQEADNPPVPASCRADIDNGLSSAQVIASIEEADKQRLRQAASFQRRGSVLDAINWRLPIGDSGHGEVITIAQQIVYIGNVSYLAQRPWTVEIMKHLLNTDPDLAWGRMRFANGKHPDVTLCLACYKARYDLVATMAFHPTADYYLPSWAPMMERPCPKLCLVEFIDDLENYNNGKGNDWRRNDRDRCLNVLIRLHKKRHGLEQRILERVMTERLGDNGAAMSKLLISY